jgi:hypothetical protein
MSDHFASVTLLPHHWRASSWSWVPTLIDGLPLVKPPD